jgi:DNA-binding response OmpR family regulator
MDPLSAATVRDASYTREQRIDAMYGDERVVFDRTVDSHVKEDWCSASGA